MVLVEIIPSFWPFTWRIIYLWIHIEGNEKKNKRERVIYILFKFFYFKTEKRSMEFNKSKNRSRQRSGSQGWKWKSYIRLSSESHLLFKPQSLFFLFLHTHIHCSLSLYLILILGAELKEKTKNRERYVLCSLWLSSSLSLSKLVLWLPFLLHFFGTGSSLFFSVSDLVRSYHSITVPNLQLPSIRPYLLQFWHFCLSFWYHIHGFSFNCIMDLPFHCTPCFSVFISCFEIMGMLNFNHYQMGILKQNVFCLDLLILENSKKVACVLVLHCFAVFKLDEFHAVPMLWWEFIGTICFLLCLRCMCFFFFFFSLRS